MSARNAVIQGKPSRERGFTLLEVMIVLAIIAIVAGLGYPSYTDYIKQSRRADGQLALLNAVQTMERCKTARFSYAACTLPVTQTTSPEKYYQLALKADDQTASTFTIEAKAQNAQASDTTCAKIAIDELGERTPAACW